MYFLISYFYFFSTCFSNFSKTSPGLVEAKSFTTFSRDLPPWNKGKDSVRITHQLSDTIRDRPQWYAVQPWPCGTLTGWPASLLTAQPPFLLATVIRPQATSESPPYYRLHNSPGSWHSDINFLNNKSWALKFVNEFWSCSQ